MLAFTTACDDFLKDDSGDLLIPKSLTEFTALLYGEGYPKSINEELAAYVLMTDDVEVNDLPLDPVFGDRQPGFDIFSGGEGREAYKWDMNVNESITDKNWAERYKNILGCNTIIEALPDMLYQDSETGLYHNLAAQAYTLRAYNYFVLINCYALPWSKESLNKPGVIIRLTPDIIMSSMSRSTIGDVYELINKDLERAFEHMALATPSSNIHLISPVALSFLANRVALFQNDWDKVIKDGEQFMSTYTLDIKDLNTVNESWLGKYDEVDDYKSGFLMMNAETNKEIIFTFGNTSSTYEYLSSGSTRELGLRVSYSYEGSLFESYDDDDLRKLAYFSVDRYNPPVIMWGMEVYPAHYEYKYHYPYKYGSSGQVYNVTYTNYRENWRTVEILLNVAEAYAQRDGINDRSIELLNQLRKNRYRTAAFEELSKSDFASGDALVRFIWEERRRELCFEEAMRFWDLRRQGMPEITHRLYHSTTEYETYVLPQGSPNYVMAIPASESDYNDGIVQNQREVILPQ